MHLYAQDSYRSLTVTHCGDGARACFGGSFCPTLEKLSFLQLTLRYLPAPVKLANTTPPLHALHPSNTLPACVQHVDFIQASEHPQKFVEAASELTPLHALGISESLNASTSIPTLALLLKKICQHKSLPAGRFLHAHIRQRHLDLDRFLGNCLIEMYGECGSTSDARSVFDYLPNHNSYSWNIMINAYVKNGLGKEALDAFYQMLRKRFDPDYCTFISTLNACTCAARLQDVQDVHALIVEYGCMGDHGVETALIAVYGKCGCFTSAMSVFCGMLDPNVVSWNALISACVQNGHNQEALDVFREMQCRALEPDNITLTSTLDACAEVAALEEGQKIHALVVKNGYHGDVTLMTALVNMYGECGSFSRAVNSFAQIRKRDVVCWNAFLSACINNDQWVMAIKLLYEMQAEGLKPDHLTYAYLLDACANLVLLGEGKIIHDKIVKGGYERDVFLGTSLVNMYGKCGAFLDAKDVFGAIRWQDLISWSAIITVCAQSGRSEEALNGFHRMKGSGIQPDHTVYLSILTACSHAGWVYDGMSYFLLMLREHGLQPTIEHYTCMVDLLGRAGHLADAEQLIITMPYEQNPTVWSCLLGACRIHGNNIQGIRAANQAIAMGSTMATSFVMLSDMLYTGEESMFEELNV